MSTLTAETPTESITTVPTADETISDERPAAGTSGPATGTEYVLTGSYAKLSRGLKRNWFTRRINHEVGAALAQAIHRAKPYVEGDKQDATVVRAKTISRYTGDGVQVLIDDIRYDVSLRRAGTKSVLVIGNLAH